MQISLKRDEGHSNHIGFYVYDAEGAHCTEQIHFLRVFALSGMKLMLVAEVKKSGSFSSKALVAETQIADEPQILLVKQLPPRQFIVVPCTASAGMPCISFR